MRNLRFRIDDILSIRKELVKDDFNRDFTELYIEFRMKNSMNRIILTFIKEEMMDFYYDILTKVFINKELNESYFLLNQKNQFNIEVYSGIIELINVDRYNFQIYNN